MYSKQMTNLYWLALANCFLCAASIEEKGKASISRLPSMALTTDNNNCSISSLDICLSKIKEVAMDSDLAFPVTSVTLNIACRKLKEGDTCADNHMKNCTNKNQKMLFQDIVKGTKKVLESLCIPGSFQNDYLRYAKCFKDVSVSEQKCAPVIKKVQSMNLDPQIASQMEDQLKKFCCTMKESEDCQYAFIRKECGPPAAAFFIKYTREISSQLMVDHCATYTFSDSCNPKIGSLSNSSFIHQLFESNSILFIIWIFNSFLYFK